MRPDRQRLTARSPAPSPPDTPAPGRRPRPWIPGHGSPAMEMQFRPAVVKAQPRTPWTRRIWFPQPPAWRIQVSGLSTAPTPWKATEMFEAAYPIIKELALAGTPGSKAVKQASQQLLPLAVKAIQENNAELDKEATDVFIWCLTQSPESYKLWDKLHAENTQATIYCNSHVLNSSILNCSTMIAILHRTIKSWIGN